MNGYVTRYDPVVLLRLKWTYRGESADSMRRYVAREGQAALERYYHNTLVAHYRDISQAGDLSFRDDRPENKIEAEAHYHTSAFWPKAEVQRNGFGPVRYLRPIFLPTFFRAPKVAIRRYPLKIHHPFKCSETITIRFPDSRSWPSKTGTVEGPAFTHTFEEKQVDAHTLSICHVRRTKKKEVGPREMAEHIASLERVEYAMSYPLAMQGKTPNAGSAIWLVLAVMILVPLVVGLVVGYVLGRRKGRGDAPSG